MEYWAVAMSGMRFSSYPQSLKSHCALDIWFALQVKPRHERTTALAIRQKGYQELVPAYLSRRKWSDREKDIELPLFPGYIFCCFDADIRAPVLTTPGVRRIVGAVEEHEISALKRLAILGARAEPWPYLEAGAKIRLQAGPLAGVEGIVLAVKDARRLLISVTLLQRSVAIEVDPRWLPPVSSAPS
jgi:transcription antitermination factor NusG